MSEIKVFARDYPMASIDKFIPYANNARTHSKEQINKLRSIYRGIGYGDPVEVDENFTILSGHGRVEAAKAEGMKELPYVMLTGMTEAEKKAYILAVNRSALDAGWDEELLAVEIDALQEMGMDPLLTGFDEKELAALYADESEEAKDDERRLCTARRHLDGRKAPPDVRGRHQAGRRTEADEWQTRQSYRH